MTSSNRTDGTVRVQHDSLGPVNVPADCEAFIRSHVYKPEYRDLL